MDFRFASFPEYRAHGRSLVTFRKRAPDRIRREFLLVRPHHNCRLGDPTKQINDRCLYLFFLCYIDETIQDRVSVIKPCNNAPPHSTTLIFHGPSTSLPMRSYRPRPGNNDTTFAAL